MTITTINGVSFMELAGSRKTTRNTTSQSVTLLYVAYVTLDEVLVNVSFAQLVGPIWDGLPIDTIACDPQGGGVWFCTAAFTLKAPDEPENDDDDEPLGMAYAVDLTAGQVHITQSLETTSGVAAPLPGTGTIGAGGTFTPSGYTAQTSDIGRTVTLGTGVTQATYTITGIVNGAWQLAPSPPDSSGQQLIFGLSQDVPNYKQAIGVTKDSVAGTDIFAPKFEFSVTVKTPVTLAYLRQVRSITAKTNNAPWKGFDTDELLCLGATGNAEPNDLFTMTYKFAADENLIGVKVSPDITINKKAWEYLWCVYRDSVNANLLVQTPRVAYTERVYNRADFNLLNLNPPICNWTSSVASGMHPVTVIFTDASSGTPLTWAWDFGDGTTSTLQNPIKVYLIPGVYTVSLTVTNGAGSSFKTVINYVIVS